MQLSQNYLEEQTDFLLPRIKTDSYSDIPIELQQLNNWIVWRLESRNGKNTKIPYNVNGIEARSNDENTWSSFVDAVTVARTRRYDGIGFMFSQNDEYIGVDIDKCYSNGEFNEIANDVIDLLDSYTEFSPSTTGVHVIVKGRLPISITGTGKKSSKHGLEVYSHGRYFSFTGNRENANKIEERTEEIAKVINKYFSLSGPIVPSQRNVGNGSNLSESEIINIALKSKIGGRFQVFMSGGWEQFYSSQSEADMAFCNDLSFFTNCDYTMMDSIFRQSSLMRDKWDRRQNSSTYGDETLRKAIADCTNTFRPQEKQVDSGEKRPWFATNKNGTRTFLHKELAQEVLGEFSIVRYPSAHSDLYYFNPKKGIYEQDKSGRQISGIIRSFDDDLKSGQIREVYNYIQDMCQVINRVNENYIALENGLLNLKSFQLEAFNSKVFVLQKVGVRYDPNVYDQFVESTLHKVTKGHEPSIKNIKEMFGCVLYPGLLVPKMFYLYGRSAHNGKSSILNMIHYTFNKDGGNISAVPPQKLASNTFAGASLYGKLANVVDDQPDQVIEDSGTLKTIITGGYIEIEKKGKDSETVKMSTVMITASNFFPNFRESGAQINRRLHIIPFEHNFSLDKECLPDGESLERISSDSAREYVLKLAVDALKEMLSHSKSEKLTVNDKSLEAAKAFAEHNDPMADYFFEHDEGYFNEMPGARVLLEYEEWCKDNRVQAIDTQRFKEIICGQYDLEWKTKKIKYNGIWKSFKGFKSKNK